MIDRRCSNLAGFFLLLKTYLICWQNKNGIYQDETCKIDLKRHLKHNNLSVEFFLMKRKLVVKRSFSSQSVIPNSNVDIEWVTDTLNWSPISLSIDRSLSFQCFIIDGKIVSPKHAENNCPAFKLRSLNHLTPNVVIGCNWMTEFVNERKWQKCSNIKESTYINVEICR